MAAMLPGVGVLLLISDDQFKFIQPRLLRHRA
jgi:hypothetical protein